MCSGVSPNKSLQRTSNHYCIASSVYLTTIAGEVTTGSATSRRQVWRTTGLSWSCWTAQMVEPSVAYGVAQPMGGCL
jgi:hypothetical protein